MENKCTYYWQIDFVKGATQRKVDRNPKTTGWTFDAERQCPVEGCNVCFRAEIGIGRSGKVWRKLWKAEGTCKEAGQEIDTGWRHW